MQTLNRPRKSERGYILVTLTLFVALMAIAAVAIAPALVFQLRRDREEEMIHRGTQYSRAIRKFFKKFGRYPTSLAELDNTNNIRFLRKHYKDPVTGKDFKLLHYSEVQMMSMGGAGIPGMTSASAMAASGGVGGLGGGGFGTTGASNSNSQGFSLSGGMQTPSGQTQTTGQENTPADSTTNSNSPTDQSSTSSSQSSPQAIGGPIVGVISTSKDKSIRAFGGKDRYNQWQFIYDPLTDRSAGLINTPAQPLLQGVTTNAQGQAGNQAPGTQGFGTQNSGAQAPGTSSSGFGSSSFGSGSFGSGTNSQGAQPQQTPPQTTQPQPQQPNQ
jgi:type II secretory pathway pseudopilin PulG